MLQRSDDNDGPPGRACETKLSPCQFPRGDRGAIEDAPETIRGLVAQSPPARADTPLTPGSRPGWGRSTIKRNAIVTRHWVCLCFGPHVFIYSHSSSSGPGGASTFRYQHFPVSLPCQRHSSVQNAYLPCRKWTNRKPTSSKWPRLPHPLSTHAPTLPGLEYARKHLRTMKDPVIRPSSPYTDPSIKGPRSQILAATKQAPSAASSMPSPYPLYPISSWSNKCFGC